MTCLPNGHAKGLWTLLLLGSLLWRQDASGQTVTLSENRTPLKKVFNAITRQTRIQFAYASDMLRQARPVTVQMQDATLAEALRLVFDRQPLDYEIVNGTVAVQLRKPLLAPPSADTIPRLTGRVSAEGKPLEGVSVTVKNSARGTLTNAAGQFELFQVPKNSVLLFSSVGYQDQEALAKGAVLPDIRLSLSVSSLDETVVIAYGKTTRRFSTGSVGRVGAEDLARQPVGNPVQALEGRVAGMYITQSSGLPGAAVQVKLRGQNSLRYEGNDPLYLIDGVPFPASRWTTLGQGPAGANQSPFNSLNPADIESIEILRDADATAIYGSRGANGVILITTKKGRAGKTQLDLNVYRGAGQVTRTMKLLNTEQYLEMRREAFANDGEAPQSYDYDVNGTWDQRRYTDWQQVMIGGTAQLVDAQATLSGGDKQTQFSASAGYRRETTVFPGDFADKKKSLRLSLVNTSPDGKFRTAIAASYLSVASDMPQYNLTDKLNLPPDAPALYDAAGELNWENETWINPLTYLQQRHRTGVGNAMINIDLSYQWLPGLFLKMTGGMSSLRSEERILTPKDIYRPSLRSARQHQTDFINGRLDTWILEPQLVYTKKAGSHIVEALLGTTFQQTIQENTAQRATGFASAFLMEDLAAAAKLVATGDTYSQYRYNALFGRLGYRFREKYLVNISARRDGSSRFGPGKQWADFGAVGLGWIFSAEKGFRESLPAFSFGKLRVSYGATGSDRISDYGYLDAYSAIGLTYQGATGLAPARLANADYGWEINKKAEAALETGFFNDRLLFSLSYYYNRSSNQLVGYRLPAITGFSTIQYNLPAVVRNTGWEMELSAHPVKTNAFSWSFMVNLTLPSNKLLAYPGLDASTYANQYEVGKSLFTRKLFHYTGVDPQTGRYSFEDVDKDGLISYPEDLKSTRTQTQTAYGGWQNTLRWGGWEVSIFLQFVSQTGANFNDVFAQPAGAYFEGFGNQPALVMDRWRQPGDRSERQMFTQGYAEAYDAAQNYAYLSDALLSDASFIRLKNVYLSYQLPAADARLIRLQRVRIYLQAQNLLTFTGYQGFDPEVQGATLPPLKVLSAGIQINL